MLSLTVQTSVWAAYWVQRVAELVLSLTIVNYKTSFKSMVPVPGVCTT